VIVASRIDDAERWQARQAIVASLAAVDAQGSLDEPI